MRWYGHMIRMVEGVFEREVTAVKKVLGHKGDWSKQRRSRMTRMYGNVLGGNVLGARF